MASDESQYSADTLFDIFLTYDSGCGKYGEDPYIDLFDGQPDEIDFVVNGEQPLGPFTFGQLDNVESETDVMKELELKMAAMCREPDSFHFVRTRSL